MLTQRKPGSAIPGTEGFSSRGPDNRPPGWADGLRKLYDSVVSEPLPDSFDDLLKKLDQADDA
ncbi:NepR family anti-sigma factor [Novosphingobium sp.]|uniref:NepR family anti-sigma factor n=1 Tax=Novosphingobium sp. TaxID=1874826 RepID=UPI0025DB5832|nr:NepR family anti-sigma factor [Novosphingobium sp.]